MAQSEGLAIVLAAGLGMRMKSARPKVMHEVADRPMIAHVLAAAAEAGLAHRIVVTGEGMDEVKAAADAVPGTTDIAIQTERRGTGHAVMAARPALNGHEGPVYVLYGDTPLLSGATVGAMTAALDGADIAVLGFRPADPTGYGRLLTGRNGELLAVREHIDASDNERRIDFCFSGLMAFGRAAHLALLDRLDTKNAQGEYYLTDVVGHAREAGLRVATAEADAVDVTGVNSRAELADAEQLMQERLRARAMAGGATLQDPASVRFSHDTHLAADVTVEPHVVFGPGVTVGEGARIRAFSHLQGAAVAAGATIGPYARLRPGADIGEGARVGNFVEIKQATVGPGAKINHLSYIGDASIGARANIGAGTVTCNYDGFDKYRTEIGEGAFIGSNASLVAPVKVGDGAYVGSGSVVTDDVEDDALAIARGRQAERPGWAAAFRAKKAKDRGKS